MAEHHTSLSIDDLREKIIENAKIIFPEIWRQYLQPSPNAPVQPTAGDIFTVVELAGAEITVLASADQKQEVESVPGFTASLACKQPYGDAKIVLAGACRDSKDEAMRDLWNKTLARVAARVMGAVAAGGEA